ncbi:MAG: CRISPR-associated protein [Parabacteroides sp.]|nr:CRISPR-associated protein [Parabacteroides sp.]
MFVNLSNHPSKTWSETQKKAAQQYGQIIDMPFPTISATGDEQYILNLVNDYKDQILSQFNPSCDVVHVMGELCFSFALVQELKKNGFVCLASTSERVVEEKEPGIKEVKFEFMRFRTY